MDCFAAAIEKFEIRHLRWRSQSPKIRQMPNGIGLQPGTAGILARAIDLGPEHQVYRRYDHQACSGQNCDKLGLKLKHRVFPQNQHGARPGKDPENPR
jgi:hypothetical protein